MVRLGGAASPTYVSIFRGLQAHFLQHGIELDWVIYSDYDALVEAFARREIDLASKESGSPWEAGGRCKRGYCRTISCNS